MSLQEERERHAKFACDGRPRRSGGGRDGRSHRAARRDEAANGAAYHVLGAPGIASLTTACLAGDRGIDIARLERLVSETGDDRQHLLFEVAVALYDRGQDVDR